MVTSVFSVLCNNFFRIKDRNCLYYTILIALRNESFDNSLGKGENAGNQHFFSPKCFLPIPKQISGYK